MPEPHRSVTLFGDHRSGVTPVPIPNTVVKPGPPMILLRGKVGRRRSYDPVKVNLGGVVSFLLFSVSSRSARPCRPGAALPRPGTPSPSYCRAVRLHSCRPGEPGPLVDASTVRSCWVQRWGGAPASSPRSSLHGYGRAALRARVEADQDRARDRRADVGLRLVHEAIDTDQARRMFAEYLSKYRPHSPAVTLQEAIGSRFAGMSFLKR